jgi:general secretion pathway protein J
VRQCPAARGFTLVEVAVALSIFALLSLLGYRALASLLDAQVQVSNASEHWGRLDRVFARIEGDLRTAVPRPVRFAGTNLPALQLATDADGVLRLEFSRAGPEFVADPSSPGQRVAYRFRRATAAGALELTYWPGLDVIAADSGRTFLLADGLAELRIRALGRQGTWLDTWPVPGEQALPAAISLAMRGADGQWLERLFVLR